MITGLSPKQMKILEFIENHYSSHGYAPSQSEIARHFGFRSLGTVQNYLVRLERAGALKKSWNARRGVSLTPNTKGAPSHRLTLAGTVAAGRPIEAITTEEILDVPSSLIQDKTEHFALKVSGDSMIEDGILHGDYVIIRKQAFAQNGETVVALIGNEATIKRYYLRDGKIELHPANPRHQPLIFDPSRDIREFRIEGILAGVIRQIS